MTEQHTVFEEWHKRACEGFIDIGPDEFKMVLETVFAHEETIQKLIADGERLDALEEMFGQREYPYSEYDSLHFGCRHKDGQTLRQAIDERRKA